MMLVKPRRARMNSVVRTASIPAPTGGLNAKDALANMKESEAPIMTNWFPTPTSVDVRNGSETHATGLSGTVDTLAFYNTGVTQKLFGVASGSIYDVTAAGAVSAAAVTGLSNSRFQSINMGTAGGFYLMMVNGADKLRYYDGSAWSADGGTYTITGVNTANCININNFKNRVWLIEKNTLKAWYLPVASIAGAATAFDLSGLFKLGGYLVAMANWTIDNASGIDDYAAFITSEGEIAIYEGTDPSSADTWALKGTFRMGKPIGYRCFTKAGADVLLLTTDGAFPISRGLLTDRSQLALAATDKISNLINADIASYKSNFGWQPIIYPSGKKLIINIPETEGVESSQYVMNTTHGAWCKFTGWNANCFEVLNDNLYFGGNGKVYKADTGQDDDGANIEAECQQAYSYFNARGAQKRFTMARPIFLSEGDINPAIVVNTDYQSNRSAYSPSFVGIAGTAWDDGDWDSFDWAGGDTLNARWQTVTAIGFSAGINVRTATKNIGCRWQATDFVYEVGGIL